MELAFGPPIQPIENVVADLNAASGAHHHQKMGRRTQIPLKGQRVLMEQTLLVVDGMQDVLPLPWHFQPPQIVCGCYTAISSKFPLHSTIFLRSQPKISWPATISKCVCTVPNIFHGGNQQNFYFTTPAQTQV